MDIERLIKKTRVPINMIKKEEEELKFLCKEWNIDLKDRRLPYSKKITFICNNNAAFQRYKRDRRGILDTTKTRSPEYIKEREEEF